MNICIYTTHIYIHPHEVAGMRMYVYIIYIYMCMCVCVCERERDVIGPDVRKDNTDDPLILPSAFLLAHTHRTHTHMRI